MEHIKKEEAELYNGDGFSGMDYPTIDKDINFAIVKINGKSPKKGYQTNTNCKELLYIMEGNGILNKKGERQKIEFEQGDVLLIDKGESYAFEGHFTAAVPRTPAWTPEQHEYIEE